MPFFIYLISNLKNNKVYVGKTNNPEKRWKDHLRIAKNKNSKNKFYLHHSIQKYGETNFTFTIIDQFDNEEECNQAEIYWINFYRSKNKKFGYNLTSGGEGSLGRPVSQKTRNKISEKRRGENTGTAKLTWKIVRKIRKLYCDNPCLTFTELSKKFDVRKQTISKIIYGKRWVDNNYLPPQKSHITNFDGRPKLTNKIANQIRKLYANGLTNCAELGRRFGVSKTNIQLIVKNKIWKNE